MPKKVPFLFAPLLVVLVSAVAAAAAATMRLIGSLRLTEAQYN